MKKSALVLIVLLLVIFSLVSFFLVGNDFSYKTKDITIPGAGTTLQGKFIKPKGSSKLNGVVILVHGDGPTDALSNGFYISLCEIFSKNRWGVITWDKQGVNGSPGNWLNQSMEDRANEISDVIKWIKEREDLSNLPIGLWGASQAGWVIPLVPLTSEVEFIILQSPAINWIEQGWYYTKNSGSSEIKEDFLKEIDLIKNSTYLEYLEKNKTENPMGEERFNFVKRNMDSDSTETLKRLNTPTLLLLGGRDKNVDSLETKRVFQETIPNDLLEVVWVDYTNHYLVKKSLVSNDIRLVLSLIFTPKYILAEEYVDSLNSFLKNR